VRKVTKVTADGWRPIVATGVLVASLGRAPGAWAGQIYALDQPNSTVSIIDTASAAVLGTFPVNDGPSGLAITPDCAKLYVGSQDKSAISVIATASREVTATIPVGPEPRNLAITPDGTRLYSANFGAVDVSVIDTASDTVIASIAVGKGPVANLSGRRSHRMARKLTSPINRPTRWPSSTPEPTK
jgi:YVTN family beta-propeller protein